MKTKITLILLFIGLQLSAGWEPFSPEGIDANRIRFYVDYSNHWVVCHNEGIYLYDLNSQSWTNYPSTLPVADAAGLDGENILVILSAGSYSDGIYSFNPGTEEYTLIEWLEGPNFIIFDLALNKYFVGFHRGLVYSYDGLTWDSCSNFDNMNIVDMDIFGNHYVVSEMDNLYNIYYSDDAGLNWQTASNTPMISDLEFDNTGKLYGVFPDESWSSGLWSSNDFGANWNVEFWATGMYCAGLDAAQDVFVGFHETQPLNEGIARWDSVSQNLYYINAGLPDLMINQITYNPAMSAIALFCCTQNGAYINYDYVGIEDQADQISASLEAWPNPAGKQLNIRIGTDGYTEVRIHTLNGQLIDNFTANASSGKLTYDCSSLQQGVYILSIGNVHDRQSLKWIKK